jgi:hypothetical protein
MCIRDSAKGAPDPEDVGDFAAPEPVDVFAEIEAQKQADEASSAASVKQAIAEAEALEGRRAARLAVNEPTNALTSGAQPTPPPVAPGQPAATPVQ